MNMIEYVIICVILLLFELTYMKAAVKLRIFDIPHRQSSHTGVVVRGEGIVFYMAFLLWALVYGFPSDGRLIGLTILAAVSFADDIHSISPKVRFVCHFIAIVLMFHHSGLIQTSPHVIILLTMACVGAINIYNFMDGINGMTGGYSLVVALAVSVRSGRRTRTALFSASETAHPSRKGEMAQGSLNRLSSWRASLYPPRGSP